MDRIYRIIILMALLAVCISCSDPEHKEIPDLISPSIEILNPIPAQVIGNDVLVSAKVLDDVGIERVEFFIDDLLVGTDTQTPWEYLWLVSGYLDGMQHFINAKAYDLAGNIGKSDTVTVSTFGLILDIDGNTYKTIKIGTQTWMAENLSVSHYRNSDAILSAFDDSLWSTVTSGASAIHPSYEGYEQDIYGFLYNWYAVNDNRGLAPEGWHIPTIDEWLELIISSGGRELAGNRLKDSSGDYWISSDSDTTGENLFMALPGGRRHESGGYFGASVGSYGFYWASTEDSAPLSDFVQFNYYEPEVGIGHYDKRNGFSIRCVKN